MSDWAVAQDWYAGIELLSLDYVRDVFTELGLELRSQGEVIVREAARNALIGATHTGSDEVLSFYLTQVPQYRSAIQSKLGVVSLDRVDQWIKYTLCTETHNPWMQIEDIFTSWASAFRKTAQDAIELSDPYCVLRELTATLNLDVFAQRLALQRSRPLSDWDQPLFVQRGLLELPKDSDYYPWEDTVLLVIGMARFHKFWKWLNRACGERDRKRIISFLIAKAQERDGNSKASMIAELSNEAL